MRLPRACGVLLHPTSLPGPHGSGDLGAAAHHFVDWLAAAGQTRWQILPLGGIGPGHSPYMSPSAFAGNVLLIALADLRARGWLTDADLVPDAAFDARRVRFGAVVPWRLERLERAAARFAEHASSADRDAFAAFCRAQSDWLEDYALFMALADHAPGQSWCDWDQALARRDPAALQAATSTHAARIDAHKFWQWRFAEQWRALRAHAHARGVRIVGDAPIYLAHQSAEVWARQPLFELDAAGRAQVVAGVPPDYFSATGQRWGNPLYRWAAHEAEGYRWWTQRIARSFERVDILRIDHFRGFAQYWEIPASAPTAVEGRWCTGPGAALFDAIATALGPLPIIAEDLGLITPDVAALRRRFALPGMRVLQFAFGDDHRNTYLPHHHEPDAVVYTGTHDNDTTLGWWATASAHERSHLLAYLGSAGSEPHWDLIRAACASVADTAIVPLQDVLGLATEARMNLPGEAEGNWGWRFEWTQVEPWHGERLAALCRLYGR
ncbi:MAG: 4-alpha-glucanotransferase [Ideonella sp.]|nr:4-alpha-glucanotransferase [Ideonella sp.]